jgi:CxxC-x17-CxxC domain-containing protein
LAANLLVCADCGAQFEFSDDERRQFESRGFAPPKRCRSCRDAKRKRQAAQDGAKRHGDGPRQATQPRPRGPASLHAATCTRCGASTEVPFVPDQKRPIYCLPCLKQQTR